MSHPSCGRPFALAFLVTALGVSPAVADVDVTGSWRLETQAFFSVTPEVYDVAFAQSGSALTLVFASNPGTPYAGTIDPATGIFRVEFASASFLCPAPPPIGPFTTVSPPFDLDGTFTPDGIRFTGEQVTYIPRIGCLWAGLSYPTIGTRIDAIACGDRIRDPGEACAGPDVCCSASCTVIDTDGDGVCDAL